MSDLAKLIAQRDELYKGGNWRGKEYDSYLAAARKVEEASSAAFYATEQAKLDAKNAVNPNAAKDAVSTAYGMSLSDSGGGFSVSPDVDPEYMAMMMQDYDTLKTTISDQITQIADTEVGVDTAGLVGEIRANFENTKNRITDSALTSVAKAGVQLDAYLGSPTGDQRSAARFSMAASVTNNMMQTAFQTIAGLYDKNTQQVVATQIEGAKINTQAVATKAAAIASFTGQATQAYLGTLGALNDNYLARLNASTQFAQLYLDAAKTDINTQLSRDQASLSAMTSLLTSSNYGIKGVQTYGAPTTEAAYISSAPAKTTRINGSIARA